MLAGRKAGKRRPANIVLAVSLSAPSASLQWSPSYFFVLWLVGFAIGRGENAGTHRFIAGSSFLTAVRANRPPPGGPIRVRVARPSGRADEAQGVRATALVPLFFPGRIS